MCCGPPKLAEGRWLGSFLPLIQRCFLFTPKNILLIFIYIWETRIPGRTPPGHWRRRMRQRRWIWAPPSSGQGCAGRGDPCLKYGQKHLFKKSKLFGKLCGKTLLLRKNALWWAVYVLLGYYLEWKHLMLLKDRNIHFWKKIKIIRETV